MPVTHAFSDATSHAWTVADVKAALVRRSRVLLIAFAALSAGAITAVLTAPAIHEGGFKLLVKHDRADAVVSGIPGTETARPEELSENELLSQVELLKAQDLREKVVTDAGLTTRLMATGKARTDQEALIGALDALDHDLSVKPIRKTWLIEVNYRDKDPQVAQKVLDSMVRWYFNKHLTLHRPSGTFEFFSEQVERARQELAAAQADLLRFTTTAGVVSAATEKQAALEKQAEFEALRAQTQAQLAEATRRAAAAQAELSRVPAQHTATTRTVQNAGAVQEIQSRVLTLDMRRTELLQRFTPEYRGVIETEQQLAEARKALAQALDTNVHEETIADNPTRQWLDTEVARAQTDSAALAARVQALSSAAAGYRSQAQNLERRSAEQNELLRTLSAAEERYRLYLAKQEEARISDELDKTRIANVAVAEAPALKPKPLRRPSLAMLPLLLIVAVFLSGGLALTVDALSASPARALMMPASHAAYSRGASADADIEVVTRRIRTNTAAFSARLAELKELTDSVTDKWTADTTARPDTSDDEILWTPIPNADGIRQSA